MICRDIIVIGASMGGITALCRLVSQLSMPFYGSIFVVQHLRRVNTNLLPSILSCYGPIPATCPASDERIQRGRIYVAKPNYHLLVKAGAIYLTQTPLVNYARPAIDPLFCSAAQAYGARVVGILLTGKLHDGTAGLAVIKDRGGTTLVQDPLEAEWAEMPYSALKAGVVDQCLSLSTIATFIMQCSALLADKAITL